MPLEIQKTWDGARLKRDRLERLQAEMKKAGMGALYLNDGVHVRYVLDLKVPGGGVFVPPRGEAIAFIRPRDQGYVKMQHASVRPPIYHHSDMRDKPSTEAGREFAGSIAELMAEYGVAGETLGVDEIGACGFLGLVQEGIKVGDSTSVIEHAWTVKTEDEVAIYKVLGQQYVSTISQFREALRPGITENELAGVVTSAWYQAGGEDLAQLNVCAGEDMNPWRRWPTQRAVQDNEFVGIDLHGRGISGLRGDASRTFFVGDKPTPEQREQYRRAYEYLLEARDEFRAGRTFNDVVASAAPRVPEEYRPQQYNLNVGHGASLGSSAYPHLDPRKDKQVEDELRPNQIISVECFFGELGTTQAVKLEEMVVIREGKPEPLAPIPFDERFLPA